MATGATAVILVNNHQDGVSTGTIVDLGLYYTSNMRINLYIYILIIYNLPIYNNIIWYTDELY